MIRKVIDQFSRFFVGLLFIFSGLIKLNDPIGTKIKLEEYFHVFADDGLTFFHALIPYALGLGFLLIVLEIILGVAVLIQFKMESSTIILLGLMMFFTFLTFYSAYFNKVTDCGCFGDAIKLTPWQSFKKDLVLIVFVLHLFWHRKRFIPILYTRQGSILIIGVGLVCVFLGVYAIRHLPILDFRAYKVGNHIPSLMLPPEQPVFEYTFKRPDGTLIQSEKYLSDTTQYQYVEMKQLNEEETLPKIRDYGVTDPDGNDVTEETFSGSKLLFIIYDVHLASQKNMDHIRSLITALDGKMDLMMLTSSPPVEADAFRHEHQLGIPYFQVDATVLKTIIRSNPGITLWVNGVVKGKWHHNDTPTGSEVMALIQP